MKLQIKPYKDKDLDELSRRLVATLSNISLDNFLSISVNGVTSPTPDTFLPVQHGFDNVPSLAFMLEGNAYVALNGLGAKTIDIRSSAASQPFKVLVIR